ncbi:MAG: hypothetical protein ABI321_08255 [Polyangia bacterium]
MAAHTEGFVADVLVPLATGGTLTVHDPIDADDVDELIEHRAALAGIAELAEARRRIAARFLYTAETPALDADSIRIGVAIHNLCWLLVQKKHDIGVVARIAAYSARVATLEPPVDEEALCARHALVDGMRTLTRHDVHVRFWAGEQTFLGEQPPHRLLRWQTVRRVHEDRTETKLFDEALGVPALRAIVASLLAASPLTGLLFPRPEPPLELQRSARWLATPAIARVVADTWLARGLPAIEADVVEPLIALYNVERAKDEAAIATSFHSHLHLLDVLARPPRDVEGHLQILRGYTKGMTRTVTDGFGLYAAADRVGLGRPADLGLDAALERNVSAYADACAELVGNRRVLELVGLVSRGAGEHVRVA